jgi:hypothetical protein
MESFFKSINQLKNLSIAERYLLIYMYANMTDIYDELQKSMLSIELDTGISGRHVRTLTRSLQAKGYLTINRNSQEFSGIDGANSYMFTDKLYVHLSMKKKQGDK